MAGVVAQSYSEALFSLGMENKQVDVFKEQLTFVINQLKNNPEFAHLLAHPKLHKDEKKDMIKNVFKDTIDHTLLNFLLLLIDKNRFQKIDAIHKEFNKRYNKEFNIEVAFVTSAKALTKEEEKRIQTMLENKLDKKVEMKVYIDSDVIAGVRIKIGDIVLDHTAKNRILQLKELASASQIIKNRGEL